MQVIKEEISKDIKIEVKRFEHEKEVYILCRSKQKGIKERSMHRRVEDLFLERLNYYREGLTIPWRTKKYKKVLELIGRLKEKYSKASKLYSVEVIPEKEKSSTDSNLLAIDIIHKKKDELYGKGVGREGSYILRTNRSDLTDKGIWEIYVMLTKIENAFKNMKSFLGLRPNFHQKENRVDTHVFISVTAYHILNIIEYRLRQKGDHRSWKTIRDVLKTHERLTISYQVKDEDGHAHQHLIRINSKLEPEHLEIDRKFNLSGVPLPRKRMKVE